MAALGTTFTVEELQGSNPGNWVTFLTVTQSDKTYALENVLRYLGGRGGRGVRIKDSTTGLILWEATWP